MSSKQTIYNNGQWFCVCVRPPEVISPAAENGPIDMIFGMGLDIDDRMRGAPLHVYYIQFGQYTHPMGSSRPPWAAGEL